MWVCLGRWPHMQLPGFSPISKSTHQLPARVEWILLGMHCSNWLLTSGFSSSQMLDSISTLTTLDISPKSLWDPAQCLFLAFLQKRTAMELMENSSCLVRYVSADLSLVTGIGMLTFHVPFTQKQVKFPKFPQFCTSRTTMWKYCALQSSQWEYRFWRFQSSWMTVPLQLKLHKMRTTLLRSLVMSVSFLNFRVLFQILNCTYSSDLSPVLEFLRL